MAVLAADVSGRLTGRIFGLDSQLIADTCILAVSIFVLFTALSYLLFEPVREFLRKRQDIIQKQLESAKEEQEIASAQKEIYLHKLERADKETETILELARKKARDSETVILKEAETAVFEMKKRAEKEAELQKQKLREEGRREIILVAAAMANKMIMGSMDTQKQEELFETALQEMGETTWRNQQ